MKAKIRNLATAVIQFMKSLLSKTDTHAQDDPYVIH